MLLKLSITSFKIFKGRYRSNFFRKVKATVGIDWLEEYNEFTKLYFGMNFKMNKISTDYHESLLKQDKADLSSQKPTIEFFDYVCSPNSDQCEYKIVKLIETDTGRFKCKNLDTIDWLYHTMCVIPDTMKMFDDMQYKIPEKQALFAKGILIYYDKLSTKQTYIHTINLIKQFDMINLIRFKGPFCNFEVIFKTIKCIFDSGIDQKIMYKYKQDKDDRDLNDEDVEVPSEYRYVLERDDDTTLQFPLIKM